MSSSMFSSSSSVSFETAQILVGNLRLPLASAFSVSALIAATNCMSWSGFHNFSVESGNKKHLFVEVDYGTSSSFAFLDNLCLIRSQKVLSFQHLDWSIVSLMRSQLTWILVIVSSHEVQRSWVRLFLWCQRAARTTSCLCSNHHWPFCISWGWLIWTHWLPNVGGGKTLHIFCVVPLMNLRAVRVSFALP